MDLSKPAPAKVDMADVANDRRSLQEHQQEATEMVETSLQRQVVNPEWYTRQIWNMHFQKSIAIAGLSWRPWNGRTNTLVMSR